MATRPANGTLLRFDTEAEKGRDARCVDRRRLVERRP
jgi:hypothetical protein